MFVRTIHLLDAIKTASTAQGEASALRTRVASQDVTIDWLRTRVNQLEKERALLFREVTHLNIPTVELARVEPPAPVSMHLPTFEDVGDEAADFLGIQHDENGELSYVK